MRKTITAERRRSLAIYACIVAALFASALVSAWQASAVGPSIGIAPPEAASETLADLVDRADRAIYDARRSGGGYRFSPRGREIVMT